MIFIVKVTASSNIVGGERLEEKFIQRLEEEISNGARVITIVSDGNRLKKAYLEKVYRGAQVCEDEFVFGKASIYGVE
tara:strand:- start:154 stop:387 length:234 start_codon:yes stop_codon:yes gene_type:complete